MVSFVCGRKAVDRRATRSQFALRVVCLLGLLLIGTVAQAQTITKVFTSPSTVIAGGKSELVVDISAKATSNLTVNLSSDTACAEVPATMTIKSGYDYGTVTFPTTGVDVSTYALITATLGSSTGQGALIIKMATVVSVTLGLTSVAGGDGDSLSVTLNGPAGRSGMSIPLKSSNSAVATLPAGLTIRANFTSGSATVTTYPVDTTSTVTFTATTGAVSQSASLQVLTAKLWGCWSEMDPFVGGTSGNSLNVVLTSQAGPSGVTIAISCSSPLVTIPSTAVIPPDASGVVVPFTTKTVGTNVNVSFMAQQGTVASAQSAVVTIESPIQSPWPENGNSAGNTSCAYSYSGNGNAVGWTCALPAVANGPVIGSDGAFYFTDGSHLNAVSSSGVLQWQVSNSFQSVPAIGPDGTIYATASNGSVRGGYLLAYDTLGRQKWGYSGTVTGYYPYAKFSPTIGLDGSIYVWAYSATGDELLAVEPNKSVKWMYSMPVGFEEISGGSPVCGADGSIYFVIKNISAPNTGYLVSINGSTGVQNWTYAVTNQTLGSGLPFVLDENNTIYISTDQHNLWALNSDGTSKWEFIDGTNTVNSISLMYSGYGDEIYFCDRGSVDSLAAISTDGLLLWRTPLPSGTQVVSGIAALSNEDFAVIQQSATLGTTLNYYYGGGTQQFYRSSSSKTEPIFDGNGHLYWVTTAPSLVQIK